MRFSPGEEAQIDFGEIGRLPLEGKARRVYLFVMTLCFSRYAYYELLSEQRVPSFLGAIRNAFEYFGGAPRRVKPDNLKAAVLIDRLGQRYYQEDFFRFCQHYGTVPDAARPATPTDKGRTERDIGYAKGNCFRGRSFESFEQAALYLSGWRDTIANLRVHGTTRCKPQELFEAAERAALVSLPLERYEIAEWGLYRVRKDCHVHVAGNYYSVPYRLVGSRVLVRLSEEAVSIFAEGERVAHHAKASGQGRDVTDRSHYPPTKRIGSQEIHRQRLLAIRAAGPHSARFLRELRQASGSSAISLPASSVSWTATAPRPWNVPGLVILDELGFTPWIPCWRTPSTASWRAAMSGPAPSLPRTGASSRGLRSFRTR